VDSDELQVDMKQEVPTLGTIKKTASIETDTNEPCAGGEVEAINVPKATVINLPNDAAAWSDVIDHSLRVELVKAGQKKVLLVALPEQFKVGDSTKKWQSSF